MKILTLPRSLLLGSTALGFGLLLTSCAETSSHHSAASTSATSSTSGSGAGSHQVVKCVLKHEATRHQREVAQENARRAYFSQSARRRAALRHGKRSRYIAVQTVRNTESSGEASCMVFDTRNQQIVGNTVYDCDSVPAVGATAKFDSFDATYVGS
ncbi:MAG: hypothetical protein JO295_10865 [Verrucomicrobia bacterium]|nr:hypothetical protein [Verrucomicrobiota bacterium]